MTAADPPICTDGPSRPSAMPLPMASSPPTYLTGRMPEPVGPYPAVGDRLDPRDSAALGVRFDPVHQRGRDGGGGRARPGPPRPDPTQLPCAQRGQAVAQPRAPLE